MCCLVRWCYLLVVCFDFCLSRFRMKFRRSARAATSTSTRSRFAAPSTRPSTKTRPSGRSICPVSLLTDVEWLKKVVPSLQSFMANQFLLPTLSLSFLSHFLSHTLFKVSDVLECHRLGKIKLIKKRNCLIIERGGNNTIEMNFNSNYWLNRTLRLGRKELSSTSTK